MTELFALVTACSGGGQPEPGRHNVVLVAVQAVAEKPDGQGGLYVLYLHHDQTAELQHRIPGHIARTLIPKQIMYRVRAAMVELGIAEDGWSPA